MHHRDARGVDRTLAPRDRQQFVEEADSRDRVPRLEAGRVFTFPSLVSPESEPASRKLLRRPEQAPEVRIAGRLAHACNLAETREPHTPPALSDWCRASTISLPAGPAIWPAKFRLVADTALRTALRTEIPETG
jgi:hypothetical protein